MRTKVYHKRGGTELVVESGGTVRVQSGGTLVAENGSTITGLTGQTTFSSSAEVITGAVTDKVIAPDTLATLTATATRKGLIEIATDAETQTGTDATRAVSPASLAARTGTTARSGVLQLATNAEALAGTDTAKALTPAAATYRLDLRKTVSFAGRNLAGACTLAGVKVGDKVACVTGLVAATVGDQSAKFESTITVNDQIQQSQASDLSTYIYVATIVHLS